MVKELPKNVCVSVDEVIFEELTGQPLPEQYKSAIIKREDL